MNNFPQIVNCMKVDLLKKEAVIVIATPILRKAVISEIEKLGLNFQEYKSKGQFKFFDAAFLLSNLLIDGKIDLLYIQRNFAPPIENLKLKFGAVHIIDEMVDVLWRHEEKFIAANLRKLWKERSKKIGFTILFCKSPPIRSSDAVLNPRY